MLTEAHWHPSGITKGELSLTVCNYEVICTLVCYMSCLHGIAAEVSFLSV